MPGIGLTWLRTKLCLFFRKQGTVGSGGKDEVNLHFDMPGLIIVANMPTELSKGQLPEMKISNVARANGKFALFLLNAF